MTVDTSRGRGSDRHLPRRRRDDDRGVVAAVAAAIVAALYLVAAFAFDGGQLLRTFTRADDLASGAARAAAQGIDTSSLLDDTPAVALDPPDARARAAAFLAEAGHPGTGAVSVSGAEVTVTVTLSHDPRLFPTGRRDVSATATASATPGVTGAVTEEGS